MNLKDTAPEDCKRQVDLTRGISHEGVFAAVVAVVFTLYALLFNGLAYALLTSDATFSNLTRLQRMLISNKLLRGMMSPCERARCQCVRGAMSVTPLQVLPAIVAAGAVPDDGGVGAVAQLAARARH